MKSIGFVISHKVGEKRRAILPEDIRKNVTLAHLLYIEQGYGESIGITDDCYKALGCNIVSRQEALSCDVVVDVKIYVAQSQDEIDALVAGKKLTFGTKKVEESVPAEQGRDEEKEEAVSVEQSRDEEKADEKAEKKPAAKKATKKAKAE